MRPYDPKRSSSDVSVGIADDQHHHHYHQHHSVVVAPPPMHMPSRAEGSTPSHNVAKKKLLKQTNYASFLRTLIILYVWVACLTGISLWTFLRYTTVAQSAKIAREVFSDGESATTAAGGENSAKYSDAAAAPAAAAAATDTTHTYPFNIYDDTANRIVRYPQTGGIPHLDWNKVRNFRACCKDDDNLRCFSTNEVALRRDPERTSKGLSDVYLEIKQVHRSVTNGATSKEGADWKPIGSRGARCQLVWTACKVKVES